MLSLISQTLCLVSVMGSHLVDSTRKGAVAGVPLHDLSHGTAAMAATVVAARKLAALHLLLSIPAAQLSQVGALHAQIDGEIV